MKTLGERFWEKVNKDGPVIRPELGPCWIWKGAKNSLGYGHIFKDGSEVYAHRLSYEFAYGSVPEGLDILHKCDNPTCIRPDHLFPGTHKQNIDDMVTKGRCNRAFGENAGPSKLTTEQVHRIKSRESSGERQIDLAFEYGINQSEISKIVRGKRRKYE
jgi:hypothetical protein